MSKRTIDKIIITQKMLFIKLVSEIKVFKCLKIVN